MTIVRDPGVRSGEPVVEGTRITVSDVAERFYKLGRSASSIASDLGLSEDQVEEALRYYHDQAVEKKTGSAAEAQKAVTRFLADENIDQPVVEKLRSEGFDVAAVEEEIKGASDTEVLEKAISENRILVTFDRDFSNPETEHLGIIRLTNVAEYDLIVKVVDQLSQHFTSEDFQNTVVEASPSDYR